MRRTTVGLTSLAMFLSFVAPAAAQEVTAHVRTWTGQTWRLMQPSVELFYTIMPPPREGGIATTPPAEMITGGVGQNSGARLFGSPKEVSALLQEGAVPMQGQRQATSVTLSKDGIETRIPLERLTSLLFSRQPVWNGALPPYVVSSHFRYAATAVLTDGSRIEGDYVNLGTALLRGMTPQGRVEIPWQEVESVRFER
jgi:hypothetical protein